jgi:hypothetical protein
VELSGRNQAQRKEMTTIVTAAFLKLRTLGLLKDLYFGFE